MYEVIPKTKVVGRFGKLVNDVGGRKFNSTDHDFPLNRGYISTQLDIMGWRLHGL